MSDVMEWQLSLLRGYGAKLSEFFNTKTQSSQEFKVSRLYAFALSAQQGTWANVTRYYCGKPLPRLTAPIHQQQMTCHE